MNIRFAFIILVLCFTKIATAQSSNQSSSNIILQLKKLKVFGSVLYIAAHPDDENTRLLGYLANEKKYRTGYLSLTRGDGGQNLIGNEQGIDLGLIRTQELLAARRIDGAEQYFTRAYDFGFSKSPEEALKIWDHDLVLADVVWVIRNFKPDVIIARFPTTGEGGHGHHTASAILASEAFDIAADSTKFTEQFKYVKPWQAKRLLWNTFNFNGNNTTKVNQFKIDCGAYNALLGKSYGEIAAESRSSHRSQGFGVPAQRGKNIEYFTTLKGEKFTNDFLEGIDSSKLLSPIAKEYFAMVDDVIKSFNYENPAFSVKQLITLYKASLEMPFFSTQKRIELQQIIKTCAGLFFEAIATNQLNTIGDSMKVKFSLINRSSAAINSAQIQWNKELYQLSDILPNELANITATQIVNKYIESTQPYYLIYPKNAGSFSAKQSEIGQPEISGINTIFKINIYDTEFEFETPIKYKFTDPVKGELYQPVQLVNKTFVNVNPNLILLHNNSNIEKKLTFAIQSNTDFDSKAKLFLNNSKSSKLISDTTLKIGKSQTVELPYTLNSKNFENNSSETLSVELTSEFLSQTSSLKKISYDHIPDIFYNYQDNLKVLKLDLKTNGTRAGYIEGAGDKIPEALEQMGYIVTTLTEKDITSENLKKYDVIITGVRAYNMHLWLNNVYPILMDYVNKGGTYFIQYNTNNGIGPVKAKMSPYPFTISRNRITNETAEVKFLMPNNPLLNHPNKITSKDFDGWVQERSIYHAEKIDSNFNKILSMQDPNEPEQDGALISLDYGKGRLIYTGLVFFRELPAAVPGAYRLFANLIAKRKL